MLQLFGFPVFTKSLSNCNYDRDTLIKTIESNYKIKKNRDQWDHDPQTQSSHIHHSLNDESNKIFAKPDYSSLLPHYDNCIQEFLNQLKLKTNVNYTWEVVNYTCMENDMYMRAHTHVSKDDFTAVHYLQYDDSNNNSTFYENSSSHSHFLKFIRPYLPFCFDRNDIENSYLFEDFKLPTKEDDLVIIPSCLQHSIQRVKTSKLRITIVLNIRIEPHGKTT
tara:strand:- start:35 stop:697 length:663 start_codon:yes stop_codon:yes gene_type:complete